MRVSQDGIDLIKSFEGCKLEAYKCPAGVWTIGYGSTGAHVKEGMSITLADAERMLVNDLDRFERDVTWLAKVPLKQCQFDALVSFAYNVGSDIDSDAIAEGLGDSTLMRKLNSGDVSGSAEEFKKWNKAGGKVLSGLTRRREAERLLFLGDPKWRDKI
jgi:lysozyme